MTPRELRSEIARVATTLVETGMAIDLNLPVLQQAGQEVLVTWPKVGDSQTTLTDNMFATIQEYRHLILNRQYTCVLVDGALLQMSFAFRNTRIARSRLAYYPCPVAFESQTWDPAEVPLLDFLDDLLIGEFNNVVEDFDSARSPEF